MSWGTELWDRFHELTNHHQNGIDFLEHSVANFVRERGKIEAAYAKDLRSLVKKFSPKETQAGKNGQEPLAEQLTHILAYKQMLKEVNYQANQHDIMAENFSKERYKGILDNVKRLKEKRKNNLKDSDKIAAELKKAYKTMDSAKEKFRKAFEEQEKAIATFNRANADGSVTKNEVGKLKTVSIQKSQQCDEAKGKYASQLVKTNEFQSKYYLEKLPQVLNDLQKLEMTRIEHLRDGILACVDKEKEVMPIISKCLDSVAGNLHAIRPREDTEILVEKFKSGDVPPADFKFEDMSDPQSMLSQEAKSNPTNLNLYPKKRELERLIAETEKELHKKNKELDQTANLAATFKNNPKQQKKIKEEVDKLRQEIPQIESVLKAMTTDLREIETRLESLRSRSPMVGSPRLTGRGHTPRSSHSSGSLKSSSLSVGSSPAMMNTSPDNSSSSVFSAHTYERVQDPGSNSYNDPDDNWDHFENIPPPPPVASSSSSSLHGSSEGPVPAAAALPPSAGGSLLRVVSLYPYDASTQALQESNLPMAEGEEFEVVEPDSDGWTRVKRINNKYYNDDGEGYVPSSFLKSL